MVPTAAFSVYRNFPSALMVISRFVDPEGLIPTTVPGNGASVPFAAIENPAIVDERAFET
jgi:hypothetical protein